MTTDISLSTALALTGWSERTFWRRVADGSVERNAGSAAKTNKARIEYATLVPHLLFSLGEEEIALLYTADAGEASAQVELAVLFYENARPKEAAYWLELAAKQGNGNAMRLYGQAYVDGNGVENDENLGMMWIAKAASTEDSTARAMMDSILGNLPAR